MLWLLPLLLLRLLLPTGVMPADAAGHASLALCSEGLPQPAAVPDREQRQPRPGGSHADSLCPFAAAAALAPPSAPSPPAPRIAASDAPSRGSQAQRTARSGPRRSQLSRAPPSLS